MNILWAPWRIQYIVDPKPESCVFCIPENPAGDKELLILFRGKTAFVVMNKYPYNCGHLLVVPYRHIADFGLLTTDESLDIMSLLQTSTSAVSATLNAQGVNIGLNLGEAAGAGIRQHLHFHVVPRWNGDSSFLAVMDDIRSLPQYLSETYALLQPYFAGLQESPLP